jgi:flagellar protein FliO/FliZ
MRWLPPFGAFFALQGTALAIGEPMPGNITLLGSILQMVAALAVVLGIILLFYYVSSRVLKIGALPGGTQKYIRLIESRFLAPKKSLLLVEVGGEYLLLASSGDDIRFIKQIDMLEEIEVLGGPVSDRSFPGVFQNKIVDLVSRLPKKVADHPKKQAESGGCR